MRGIVAFDARPLTEGKIRLSRCLDGVVETIDTSDWMVAVYWLVRPPAGDGDYITICFSLHEFTRALLSLFPEDQRDAINKQDRVYYDNVKVFHVPGRFLGLTATIPVNAEGSLCRRGEVNLQALKWWVSEDEDEPIDVKQTWELGVHIFRVLDSMGFKPTKLTSPVAVFADCYLGDARNYPSVFNFQGEFKAMEYATEMMRYEWRSAYQVGIFDKTHLYDVVSAYPNAIAQLPSTNDCHCERAVAMPSWAQWGIMYGKVEVDADVSPLVYDAGDDYRINPKGCWTGCFTTGEIKWLDKWGAGHFAIEDGVFFSFGKSRPYQDAMQWLYKNKIQPDKFYSTIAKKMSQGVSGKLDEDKMDGKKGDFYNPILACMVRSHCRLKVADFIYQNKLQGNLIAVLVDSVLSTLQVELPESNSMGNWRYEGSLPALVLSKGQIWRPGKRPQGISYEQIIEAIKINPDTGYYEFKLSSGTKRSIDLLLNNTDADRIYEHYPECGRELLAGVSKSQAIKVED